MNIHTALSGARSFSELLPIADHAEAKLSSWGERYICVAGFSGTLHIDALASRTMELLRQLNYEFSESEREPGKHLAKKIDKLYEDSFRQAEEANPFTRAFNILREIISGLFNYFSSTHSIWFQWHQGSFQHNVDFYFYTQMQLQTVFGISPEEAERRDCCRDSRDGIRRWQVITRTEASHPQPIQVGSNTWTGRVI